jgi:hypothetical protein
MSPELFTIGIVRPGLAFMAGALKAPPLNSRQAEVLLTAIAGQESALKHRKQQPGPARGFWQFERGGGFEGVLNHSRTGPLARKLIEALALPSDRDSLWQALPASELLQVGFARLLLWSDNAPLPAVGDREAGWAYYLRNWRPGKPHRDRWDAHYDAAIQAAAVIDVAPPAQLTEIDILDQMIALIQTVRTEMIGARGGAT